MAIVMKIASSLARNGAARAMSSGLPLRRIGWRSLNSSISLARRSALEGIAVAPAKWPELRFLAEAVEKVGWRDGLLAGLIVTLGIWIVRKIALVCGGVGLSHAGQGSAARSEGGQMVFARRLRF